MSRVRLPAWSMEYAVCFVTGFVILVLELVAFRLLAPYFGISNQVTGIIINGILLAMAIGYLLGGYAADRKRSPGLPYLAILLSTLYLTAVYATYGPMLQLLTGYPLISGVSAAVVLMFFLPITLLAIVPPYFIKTISSEQGVGKTAGGIYALSTLGSILGGLSTTFFFIPLLGSRNTFLLAILCLLMISLPALWGMTRLAAPLSLLAVPLLLPLSDRQLVQQLYRGESEYNLITVTEQGGDRFLHLNHQFGQHSKSLDPQTMLSGYYYDDFLFPQMLVNADTTLILGNGAGTVMTQTGYFFPTRIDGVEIDSQLTRIGQTYFDLKPSLRHKIFHEDARRFVNQSDRTYDVICVDVYAGGPYVPFHVASVEFYQRLRQMLSADGILAVNIPFFSSGTELAEYFHNTIARVFPDSTYVFENMLYGFNSRTERAELRDRIAQANLPQELKDLGKKILTDLRWIEVKHTNKIFTDDQAPVAMLTDQALRTTSGSPIE